MNSLAVLYGLFLWALATALVFLVGAPLFNAGIVAIAVLFAVTVPMIWGLLALFWRITQTFPEDRLRIGVLVAAPGLLLGVPVMLIQPLVFAGFTESGVRSHAGWWFWVYGVTLLLTLRLSRTAS